MPLTSRARRRLSAGEFAAIETRIETLLPEIYQNVYEQVEPKPMRSAGLRFDAAGRVAWDEIWGSFCDLAMAGGPPHKGALLSSGEVSDADAALPSYSAVVDELCRGIQMTTGLDAVPAPSPGWVEVICLSEGMAGWLLRAITMENVAARAHGATLDLPAAPRFRLEKEIKNIVTVIAKTSHYWLDHTSFGAQRAIGRLLAETARECPLIEPPRWSSDTDSDAWRIAAAAAVEAIRSATGLAAEASQSAGWLGVECPTIADAIAMMRVVVTDNVLARREGTRLLVPINPTTDPESRRATRAVVRAQHYVEYKRSAQA